MIGRCCCNYLTVSASFGYFSFCLVAFIPGPSNMLTAGGFRSYKYAYSYENVVDCGPCYKQNIL